MDYATLAQIGRPQMMPEAPLGGGGNAGMMYGQDQARQDGFLAQAANSAKLQAEMEAMKAGEFQAGAPGRLAEIGMKNESATDNLDAYKQDGMGRAHAFAKKYQEASDDQKKALDTQIESIGAIANATDEGGIKAAQEAARAQGHGKLGKMDLTSMSPSEAKAKASAIFQGRLLSVGQLGKERLEGIKGEFKMGTAGVSAASRERIAQINAELRKQVESAKAAQAAKKPLTASQVEALAIEKVYGDDDEGKLKYVLTRQAASRMPEAEAKAETGRSITDLPIASPKPSAPPASQGGKAAIAPPANAMPVDKALETLSKAKGSKSYGKMKEFFLDTYGVQALPKDWKD